ncbi:MAG: bifunctional glutamate N-acetyltransferase/amino-acid acetyltransferase ArgJ [Verrucomicrobiales bacterium]|nr:bifunctional glutamate N-acetyltransferase/amino-acid acetyltransferase ArgJ [Verrucomicrobiales bacterium]
MTTKLKSVTGSVVAPQGFRAAGVFCDIKRLGTGKGSDKGPKRDLALIVSDVPAAVAGMFTTNQVCAAPVKVCLDRVRQGWAQAVVVNSGNANACTGPTGLRDARSMTADAARHCGVEESLVLVGSTGRIGVPMPMPNVRRGIAAAARELDNTPASAGAAAEAIMTSDTRSKQIAVEFTLGGRKVRLGGMCKGAGMIQPGMSATGARPAAGWGGLHATMLAFLTCDAAVEPELLQSLLQEAVAASFNRITVDGDMSTNDTVLLLANGLAENPVLRARDRSAARKADQGVLREAIRHVCLELAKMIVRDGEGTTRVVTVRVEGARNPAEADAAARAVANSALVKTSWHGGDPNWGRIIDALGYSAARVVEDRVDIGYSAVGGRRVLYSLKGGRPTKVSFARLCAAAAPAEFELHIQLNQGRGTAVVYASDLTEAYVEFNKGNVSDPASLGG